MRRLRPALLALALALALPAAAGAAAEPIRVAGIDRIGDFDVRRHDLGNAKRAFGAPTSAVERARRSGRGGCGRCSS